MGCFLCYPGTLVGLVLQGYHKENHHFGVPKKTPIFSIYCLDGRWNSLFCTAVGGLELLYGTLPTSHGAHKSGAMFVGRRASMCLRICFKNMYIFPFDFKGESVNYHDDIYGPEVHEVGPHVVSCMLYIQVIVKA